MALRQNRRNTADAWLIRESQSEQVKETKRLLRHIYESKHPVYGYVPKQKTIQTLFTRAVFGGSIEDVCSSIRKIRRGFLVVNRVVIKVNDPLVAAEFSYGFSLIRTSSNDLGKEFLTLALLHNIPIDFKEF